MYNPIIECKNISLSFKNKKILKNINLSIYPGELVALIGPNGAGKTTFIKSICGLLKPDKGEIHIMGKNIYKEKSLPEIKAFIEIPTAFDYFTGEELIKYYLALDQKHYNKSQLYEFFEEHDIKLITENLISTYSQGKKQKIFLACIFLTNPHILILDEPTVSLDLPTLRMLENKILHLKEQGSTIIISSHDFHFVNILCDRIVYIREGEIVGDLYQKEIINKILSTNNMLMYVISINKAKNGIEILKQYAKIIKVINENNFIIECGISNLQSLIKELSKNNIEILEIKYYKEPSEIFLENFVNS
ncbi:MAG: ATP-binding cassette domain-containing protein [Candidatus Pacearchaeota archaeon]